jgi:hypothetical protein
LPAIGVKPIFIFIRRGQQRLLIRTAFTRATGNDCGGLFFEKNRFFVKPRLNTINEIQCGRRIAGLKPAMRQPKMRWRGFAQTLQALYPCTWVKLRWWSWNRNEITVGHGDTKRVANKQVALIRLLKQPRMVMARMSGSFNGAKCKTGSGNNLTVGHRQYLQFWYWPKITVEALIHFTVHAATAYKQLGRIN